MTGVRTWWQTRRKRLLQIWALGLAVAILVTTVSALGDRRIPALGDRQVPGARTLESWRAGALDMFQGVLLTLGVVPPPPDVVIVAIDDKAFEGLGGQQGGIGQPRQQDDGRSVQDAARPVGCRH